MQEDKRYMHQHNIEEGLHTHDVRTYHALDCKGLQGTYCMHMYKLAVPTYVCTYTMTKQ